MRRRVSSSPAIHCDQRSRGRGAKQSRNPITSEVSHAAALVNGCVPAVRNSVASAVSSAWCIGVCRRHGRTRQYKDAGSTRGDRASVLLLLLPVPERRASRVRLFVWRSWRVCLQQYLRRQRLPVRPVGDLFSDSPGYRPPSRGRTAASPCSKDRRGSARPPSGREGAMRGHPSSSHDDSRAATRNRADIGLQRLGRAGRAVLPRSSAGPRHAPIRCIARTAAPRCSAAMVWLCRPARTS